LKPKDFTLRIKLFIALVSMLLLVLGLLAVYLVEGREAHRQLEQVFNSYNRKLDIGTQVELATTEMQGAQRGLVLSYAMKDPAAAEQYKQLYATSKRKVDALTAELEPLLANAMERAAAADIHGSLTAWAPRFQKLVNLCEAGLVDDAYKQRNENKVISAKMHAATTELVKRQKKALEAAAAASNASVVRSNWIALLILAGLWLLVQQLLWV
jgi:CHASE3 domain sensor protein